MRKIAEIRKEMSEKIAALKAMDRTDVAAVEKATEELRALTVELNAANEVEAAEQRAAEKELDNLQKTEGRFSFLKFIREITEGNLTGVEAKVAEMGAEEYRRIGLTQVGQVIPSALLRDASGQNYTTDADGGYLKETMANRFVDTLRDRLVVAKLGATILTGLVGTLPVISVGDVTAAWKAEAAQGSISKSTIARATMTPHRNFVSTAFTKDLLRQTSVDVEAMLLEKMASAHAQLLEKAAIAGTGSSNEPSGILAACNSDNGNLVAMGASGGTISWAKVVELETVVNSANGNRGKVAYLTNAKVVGALKTTERTNTNGRYLLDIDGKINGYDWDWTNLVPSNLTKGSGSSAVSNLSAMIFGNFEDLYIGEWGGLDIVVDPYTRAAYGEVILTINGWNDCLVANPKSFAAIKDIKMS